MPPESSAPSFRMMFSVPPTPWLSMSAEGLRMISTRSTSSAGMRSTMTVLSLVAAGDAPAVDQDLRVLAADAAQGGLGVLADVALEADAGHALHHVADGQRLEALEVFLVVRQHGRRVVHAVARVHALRQHLDLGQLGLRDGRRLGEYRRGQGRKAHGHRDSRKCRKLFHRNRPPSGTRVHDRPAPDG